MSAPVGARASDELPAKAAVAIMARVPSLTRGKSRLRTVLAPRHCLGLQRAFLLDVLAIVSAVPGLDVYVAYHPANGRRALLGLLGPGRALIVQRGRDLGERLSSVARHLAARYHKVVLVGSDTPTLPTAHLKEALNALENCDVCLGPARDGGYYLIGLHTGGDGLFTGVDWGSERVLAQTVQRIRDAGMTYHMLEPWYDVDVPGDLAFLRRHLAELAGHPAAGYARHTAEVLATIWPLSDNATGDADRRRMPARKPTAVQPPPRAQTR